MSSSVALHLNETASPIRFSKPQRSSCVCLSIRGIASANRSTVLGLLFVFKVYVGNPSQALTLAQYSKNFIGLTISKAIYAYSKDLFFPHPSLLHQAVANLSNHIL